MTSPRLSFQVQSPTNPEVSWRMYRKYEDGDQAYPSITTIQGCLNPRMEWWTGLCAGQTAIDHASLIVSRHEEHGQTSAWPSKRNEIARYIGKSAQRDMNMAATRGDVVHEYAERIALHRLGRMSGADLAEFRAMSVEQVAQIHNEARIAEVRGVDGEPWMAQADQFWADFNPEPVVPEGTVLNEEYGYAGTADLLCRINGQLVLLDYKTKKKLAETTSPWYKPKIQTNIGLQLEAARRAPLAFDEEFGDWVPWQGQEAERQVGCAIGPNGYEVIEVPRQAWEMNWETFKGLIAACQWWIAAEQKPSDMRSAQPLTPADFG